MLRQCMQRQERLTLKDAVGCGLAGGILGSEFRQYRGGITLQAPQRLQACQMTPARVLRQVLG